MIPKKITSGALLELARRRWWALAGPLALALMVAGVLAAVLPRLYRSEATILVQGQEVPAAYVQPTIASCDLEDRLKAMIQQIMSRARLLGIAQEFDVYPELAGRPREDVVARMRQDIAIEVGERGEVGEKERWVRKDVVYFKLSFAHLIPETAMRVTSRLAQLFIEENQRARSEQARLTTRLLERELAETAERLEAKASVLSAYKESHKGELPEELEANLSALSRLQTEFETNQVALSAAEERTLLIQTAMAEFNRAQIAQNPGSVIPPPTLFAGPPEARLTALRQSLPSLEARYTPKHPNVVKTRNEIARLEAGLARAGRPSLPLGAPQDMGSQLMAARAEIGRLKGERAAILQRIGFYQRRVEATPKREQELASLKRDQETLQANYESLLKKQTEARMAESLESRQKGEQFRVIDPPNLPERPFKPNKLKLLALAAVLGLGGGLGLAFTVENADRSFRRLEDLEDYLHLNVLAMIPLIKSERQLARDRRRRLLLAAACGAGLLLYAGLFLYARSRLA